MSIRHNFVTVDEVGHIPSGLAHWRTGRFTPYRVNPPLPRMLATVALLPLRPSLDERGIDGETPGRRPEWALGPAFATANASRYFDLVCLARLAGVGWSLLGGWLIWRWANELYGGTAGALGLTMWCFGPNVLAHAQLVTPDLPAAVAGLAATYVFWHYLRKPSWPRAWFAGLLLGVAQLTKCTLLVFYAVWPLLALVYWHGSSAMPETQSRWRTRLGQMNLIGVLSLLVLNLGYGFAGSGRPLRDFTFVSRLFAGPLSPGDYGNRFQDSWLGGLPVPVPSDYLLGMDVQRHDFESHWPCYLAGEWRSEGRWYFYLYALAVKVPLGFLGLVIGSLLLTLLKGCCRADWKDELVVLLPAAVILVLVSSQTGLNYFRYALPVIPFVLVCTSKLARWCRGAWRGGLLALLLVGSIGSSLAVFPHELSYFNETAGGPANGHAHLVDSNIDWGQDLLDLRAWLAEHPEARPLYLAYFNHVDPRLIGIEFKLPAFRTGVTAGLVGEDDPVPAPGTYAISVNFVRGTPFSAPDGRGRFRTVPQYALHYFSHLRPIAKAGYTIFIYQVPPRCAWKK